ncbi:MAG: 1-acyl-sn-glycerol-3-phosphate acyltransferase [Sedimentisphaerales bacterium]|nr:1-acyl-sn-glycerol-3-phosphate acyltransferase [Sedimentisphaerales bacterium]
MRIYYAVTQLAAMVVFTAMFKVRMFGRENVPDEGGVLLLSNHQSYLDPVLCGLGLHREVDYMARDSLFTNNYFAAYIRSLNAFPIQREHADTRAIKEIINRLKAGHVVTMFPEATRSRDGRIRTIKPGLELIARRSGAVIVPIVIDGAFETWPRHQKLPGMGHICIKYGRAITPEQVKNMCKESREGLVDEINRRLRTMQNELRQQYGKPLFNYELEDTLDS